jgi:hypothetical protein
MKKLMTAVLAVCPKILGVEGRLVRLAPAGGPGVNWSPLRGAGCDNHPEMPAADLLHILTGPDPARCGLC